MDVTYSNSAALGSGVQNFFRDAYLEWLPDYAPQLNAAMSDAVNIYILNQTRKLTNIRPS